MTPRRRMSENERMYFVALLFPPLWPLAFAAALVQAIEAIANKVSAVYRRAVK